LPDHPDARNAPVIVAGEIETALAFLDYLRHSVMRKLDGLSEEQVRHRLVPSGTSLLGLVKHLTQVEEYWMHKRFAGLDVPLSPDSFAVDGTLSISAVLAGYVEAAGRTDALARDAADPERRLVLGTHGLTLRWALAHINEETARHAGHADILRELVDGATGR
jgi:uncharacterized damage-inducible protein DinB